MIHFIRNYKAWKALSSLKRHCKSPNCAPCNRIQEAKEAV